MSQAIRVRILNREYSLQVEKQDERRIRGIARYVDAKIRRFQQDHPDQPNITAPVIAALGIAEELFAEREKQADLNAGIGALVASLDAALTAGENPPVSEKGETRGENGL